MYDRGERAAASPASVADLVADEVAVALARLRKRGVSKNRAAKIAIGCEQGGMALIHLHAAVMGENGESRFALKHEEAMILADEVRCAVRNLLTPEIVRKIAKRLREGEAQVCVSPAPPVIPTEA